MPKRLEQAVRGLPPLIRKAVLDLPETARAQAEEVRLRVGQAATVIAANCHNLPVSVTARDLQQALDIMSQGSLHSVLDSLRHGFITLPGGHRMGICGSSVIRDGHLTQLRDLSSICIRIAREKKGIAEKILPKLLIGNKLPHTLILSPPGIGKTTLLRDLIRLVSNGTDGIAPRHVSVADERGELAACYNGTPQLDVGRNTDVMSGLPKADASLMLLRGMSPQVLALDEITAPEDASAILSCAGCGVTVLSTAHASGSEDLWKRPVYRSLLDLFDRMVVISGSGGSRQYEIQEVKKPCPLS